MVSMEKKWNSLYFFPLSNQHEHEWKKKEKKNTLATEYFQLELIPYICEFVIYTTYMIYHTL